MGSWPHQRTRDQAAGLGTTLSPTSPPHSCRETNLYWYQGNRCKSRVSKMAVGMGLAVAALCLVIFVLAAFLFRAKRQKLSDRWGNPCGVGRGRRWAREDPHK